MFNKQNLISVNKANICKCIYIYTRVLHKGFYDGRVAYISLGNGKRALPWSKSEVAIVQWYMFLVWHSNSNELSSEIGLNNGTYDKSGAKQTSQSYLTLEIVLGGQLANVSLMVIA